MKMSDNRLSMCIYVYIHWMKPLIKIPNKNGLVL